MIAWLLLGTALADEVEFEMSGALGAQWTPIVGDESELARGDWTQLPGVRMAQSALEVEIEGPQGTFAEVRVEEGIFHLGALEAGEAVIGWAPSDSAVVWVGRSDVLLTLDRIREAEDHALSIRPVISRTLLPLHMGGVGLEFAGADWSRLRGGLTYATASVDAPYRWVRADIHPFGASPSRRDAVVETPIVSVGGSVLQRSSESLGELLFLSGDLEIRMGSVLIAAAWVRADQDEERMEEWIGELGAGLLSGDWGRMHSHLRYERATGLETGEDWRHIGTGRIAWSSVDARFTSYVEAFVSRESGAVTDGGVVDLGRGIERANDSVSIGGLMRW